MVNIPNMKLNNGLEMPQVGFGLWKVDNAIAAQTVYDAIKTGYRLFDCACDYGNEVECGQGVARAIKEGIVKREELFIVSKLWQTFHEREHVEPICRKQLADWGIDYFDLYIMHFPVALEYVDPSVRYPPGWHVDDAKTTIRWSKATIRETWEAMEALVDAGLTRSIGVSNFQAQLLYDLLRHARIRPATLQVEHHPYLVQEKLVRLAKAEGIAFTAYSSFGPASFVGVESETMRHAKELKPLMEMDTITKIATKHNCTPAQVLLRWATQRGLAVIPKTTSVNTMKQNIESLSVQLDDSDIKEISALDQNIRFNEPSNWFPTELLWIFG